MTKKPRAITPAILLDHMRSMETRLETKIEKMGSGVEAKMEKMGLGLESKMERMEQRITHQIDAVDQRLDRVEIWMLEDAKKGHEQRITRLERHTGLLAA